MQEKWRNLIRRLDAAIFSHQVVEVRKELLKIVARGRIPRAAIADIANQCRRVDLPEHAVSLLNRYVRPHGKIPARPSEFEKCEYAASLSQLGAHSEAAKLLEGNPNPSLSQWLFVQGMVYQKLWDFDRAIACFERALFHPKVRTGRGVLSIKTHLAAALIRARGDYDRADLLLEDVMNETSPTELGFLHRLAQMYGAEGALMRGRPQECLDRVAEGLRLYPEQNPRHEALSEGFASLAQLMLDPVKSLDSLRRVRAARDRLAELQAWEDGRLIAYHEAMIRGNRELFLRLYFGSPFPELQKRLLPKIQEMGGMPVDFDWYLTSPKNGKGEGDRYVLDVVSGAHSGGEDRLKTGQLLQRVLQALGSDPFRRFRIGDLFDRVFPGEYYNPHTAPDRIHQGVMRLRRWFEENKIPVTVGHEDGFYWLHASQPTTLKITRVPGLDIAQAALLTRAELDEFMDGLREAFSTGEFGPAQVAQKLDLSRRSANRRLQDAVTAGLLDRLGGGRSTRYRLKQVVTAPLKTAA